MVWSFINIFRNLCVEIYNLLWLCLWCGRRWEGGEGLFFNFLYGEGVLFFIFLYIVLIKMIFVWFILYCKKVIYVFI